jgi:hypothetical protein
LLSVNASWMLCLLVLLPFAALAGCGSNVPKTYPVKGKVVFKGKGDVARLSGHHVRFESVSDAKLSAVGEIEDDGTFSLGSFIDGKALPGLPEGTYKACLEQPEPEDEDRKPPPVVHSRFLSTKTSGWEFKVPSSDEFTLEVEGPKR